MRPSLGFLVGGLAFAAWVGLSASVAPTTAQGTNAVVFAAASLKNALDEINQNWERQTGKKATLVYAGSNVLAKQIEAGAPADLFISADQDWMDYAASKKLLQSNTRVNLLGNTMVLIASKDAALSVKADRMDIASLLGSGRLAMGNLDAVPAGKYGKAALERLGEWEAVKDKVAQAENVRAALLLVSRGEAPLGIVYGSDAVSDPTVKVVATFPPDSHPPIIYPAALIAGSTNTDAPPFLKYLGSAAAKHVFEAQGFIVLNNPDPRS